MSGSQAMLCWVVREAIRRVAAPEVAERIELLALGRAGCDELPTDPSALARFVDEELFVALASQLGEDAAEAVQHDLAPIFASARAGTPSPKRDVAPRRDPTARGASAEEEVTSRGVEDGVMSFDEAASFELEEVASAVYDEAASDEYEQLLSAELDALECKRTDASPRAETRERVLVADADVQVLLDVAEALGALGFEVITAEDGYVALELCQNERPQVVVADLHMPAVSARQLIQTLERTMGTEAPPVIIITGNVFAPTHVEGAAEVLRKPVDIEELTTAIELAAWDHAAGI